ncbi:MAG: hypothetical protein QOH41_3472 [Blastocatellia bacterium]|jgi:hypothetical protein|nr:hypothetical protein [Blastocatellia bacterium]
MQLLKELRNNIDARYKHLAPNGAQPPSLLCSHLSGRLLSSFQVLLGHPNGLIPSHLALKVAPQETHSIVLKKKVTTRY